MSRILLGIGDLGATNAAGGEVRTLALGSCVSLILLEPKSRTVGMAHVALPDSKVDRARAEILPGYFADTAVVALMEQIQRINPQAKRCIVKLVGGASVMDPGGLFNIGKRNVTALKKALWQRRMGAMAEEVGGTISRTVSVRVVDAKVVVSTPGRPDRVV